MRDDMETLGARMNLRIFADVAERARVVMQVAKDSEGGRRYDSISHFARCAFMKLLIEEERRYKARARMEARQEAIIARRDRLRRSMADYEGGFIDDETPSRKSHKKKLILRKRGPSI